MLFLVLGIIIAIGGSIFYIVKYIKTGILFLMFLIPIIVLFGLMISSLGDISIVPQDAICQEEIIPLVSITLDSGKEAYVTVDENNYSYRYEITEFNNIKDPDSEVSYKIVSFYSSNVTEIESSDCDSPTLYIRKYKNKCSLFRSGIGYNIKYVFYVPEGTIATIT